MKAALLQDIGGVPTLADIDPPIVGEGEILVETIAAPLNPADLAIAAGHFHAGHPQLPYSPGLEAVGRVEDRMVFVYGGGLGVSRSGTLAEQFIAPEGALIDLPDGADPSQAAALGTAGLAGWLPITHRAKIQPGETVLILGATGTAGTVALQAARAAGAGRVVAAGRNREKLSDRADLADATVLLEGDDLAQRLQDACSPGADVVFDPLWGSPLTTALAACAPDARIVHVGAAAGQSAELASAVVRGRRLSILGYSNLGVPRSVVVDAYLEMVRRSISGELRIPVISLPLTEVARAWMGTKNGEAKFVLKGNGQ